MSLPVKTGLPDNLVIGDTYTIRFTATSPTDGSLVSGVVVSAVSVLAEVEGGTGVETGPFMLVPGPGA